MATIISASAFRWRGSRLYLNGKIIARIIADETYPKMWRVVRPDGSLSDMANVTRARDACTCSGSSRFKWQRNGSRRAKDASASGRRMTVDLIFQRIAGVRPHAVRIDTRSLRKLPLADLSSRDF